MIFKNYKQLYETELANRKAYEQRYREKEKECQELQEKTGLANLRVKYDKLISDKFEQDTLLRKLKEELAKVRIELEDTKGFLAQETQAKEVLKKERTNLKRELTNLKKKLKEE